ncbi:MAG: hypothetical protein EAX96_15025 [Candidatus Lokiarchaeota archaeon]|nr:hypothetical protein [Candidatus Lokiarchaeota archaeon]
MFLGYISLLFSKLIFFFSSVRHKKKLPPKPYLNIKNELLKNGFSKIFDLLSKNLKPPLGKIKNYWGISSEIFFGCYLWDTAFISQVWKYWDAKIAYEILKPFIDNQLMDGRISDFINPFKIGNKTQPPLLAWAISDLDVPIEYLNEVYPILRRFNEWLYDNRRLKNGLFSWIDPCESGINNSPRLSDMSGKSKKDLSNLATIDLNSYIVLQNKALIKIAKKLDDSKFIRYNYKSDILEYEEKNKKLIDLIQKYLWDAEYGLYFDYNFNEERRIEINTIASFLPLTAEIPNEQQILALIKHLESSFEYNTKIPLPSVAHNDKKFTKDMGSGPVWLNLAYLVIKGLEKKEILKFSGELAYKLVKAIFKTYTNEGSFYEFYDPDRYDLKKLSRMKGNLYKRLTRGKKPVKNFVGWTGLVNSLLIESIIGFDIIEKTIQPRFPEDFKGKNLELGFPAFKFVLEISYSSDKDIIIKLSDLERKKEDLIKKCSLYQKISLKEFFAN